MIDDSDRLKPCPFCGGAAEMDCVRSESGEDPNEGGYFIACLACDASTGMRFACGDDPKPLLIEQWNRRAALRREAHTWWTAARDAATAERRRCALRVALHSQYPITTDFDRGYDKARKDAAETLRTMDAEPARPPTPVGWSDTDWLAHLESLRQNEAAYDKGPLPERGWD